VLTVPCPNCGAYNDDSAEQCYRCQTPLPARPDRRGVAGGEQPSAGYRRPGCVAVYALWMIFSGILGVFFALYLPTFFRSSLPALLDPANLPPGSEPIDPQFLEALRPFLAGYSVFIFLVSIIGVLIGWGLWTMRNWARVLILLTQGLALAAGVAALFYSIASTQGNLFICGSYAASLVFPGIVFLWFLLNRRLFR
jgi:hypothetical protein